MLSAEICQGWSQQLSLDAQMPVRQLSPENQMNTFEHLPAFFCHLHTQQVHLCGTKACRAAKAPGGRGTRGWKMFAQNHPPPAPTVTPVGDKERWHPAQRHPPPHVPGGRVPRQSWCQLFRSRDSRSSAAPALQKGLLEHRCCSHRASHAIYLQG